MKTGLVLIYNNETNKKTTRFCEWLNVKKNIYFVLIFGKN